MANYSFELVGCNDANIAAVKAAIAAIPGVSFSLEATAKGGYILIIECGCSEEEIFRILNDALGSPGVKVAKITRIHMSLGG